MDTDPDPVKFSYITQFEEYMKRKLPKPVLQYVQSGADDEVTLRKNITDYESYRIQPHMMNNVSHIDTHTSVLGAQVSMPICVAPTGYQRLCHHDGEVANAKAAASVETIWTMSMMANTSITDVAEAVPDSTKWQQIYVFKNRLVTEAVVKRAARHGFKALVLTVDAPMAGKRRASITDPLHLPPCYSIPNMEGKESGINLVEGVGAIFDATVEWDIISWLKEISGLPVVVKGILSASDALLAIQNGADAIWVSNHGGRQLDYAPSTISVLREVVEAVNGRVEVYVDGGVRTGVQAFLALALGARAVFVGRPVVWGLASAGESGVKRVLEILREELRLTMALAGCANIEKITPDLVSTRYAVSRI